MSSITTPQPQSRSAFARYGARPALIAFGWLNVGIGLVGVVLPLLPTTVFLLIALWAFSKSSPRFHTWLYSHPRFGPVLHDWHMERAIPGYAKALALTMMGISVAVIGASSAPPAVVLVVSTGLGVVALWIVTRARPSRSIKRQKPVPIWRRSL